MSTDDAPTTNKVSKQKLCVFVCVCDLCIGLCIACALCAVQGSLSKEKWCVCMTYVVCVQYVYV